MIATELSSSHKLKGPKVNLSKLDIWLNLKSNMFHLNFIFYLHQVYISKFYPLFMIF